MPSVTADAPALSRAEKTSGECSADVRVRVEKAHAEQHTRQGKCNARLTVAKVAQHCRPALDAETLLPQAMARLFLSAREYHRILKVARTIADLAGSANVTAMHVAEAIQLRRFERAT